MSTPCEIPLSRGKVALVDSENFEWLSQWKWYFSGSGYAVRKVTVNGKQSAIYMHREIMRALPSEEIDHINGEKLDNCRHNLRVCSHSFNLQNIKMRSDSKTGYRGVTWDKRKERWRSTIQINGKQKYIGTFSDILDAAYAYNLEAISYYGQYAKLNELPEGFQPRNSHLRSSNSSGHKGISWKKSLEKWAASVTINGKLKHVGYYATKEEAVAGRSEYVKSNTPEATKLGREHD